MYKKNFLHGLADALLFRRTDEVLSITEEYSKKTLGYAPRTVMTESPDVDLGEDVLLVRFTGPNNGLSLSFGGKTLNITSEVS